MDDQRSCWQVNAHRHEERSLRLLAVNAAPCGYCRQMLAEIFDVDQLKVLFPSKGNHESVNFPDLLPKVRMKREDQFEILIYGNQRFGPSDLGNMSGVLCHRRCALSIQSSDLKDPCCRSLILRNRGCGVYLFRS